MLSDVRKEVQSRLGPPPPSFHLSRHRPREDHEARGTWSFPWGGYPRRPRSGSPRVRLKCGLGHTGNDLPAHLGPNKPPRADRLLSWPRVGRPGRTTKVGPRPVPPRASVTPVLSNFLPSLSPAGRPNTHKGLRMTGASALPGQPTEGEGEARTKEIPTYRRVTWFIKSFFASARGASPSRPWFSKGAGHPRTHPTPPPPPCRPCLLPAAILSPAPPPPDRASGANLDWKTEKRREGAADTSWRGGRGGAWTRS